MPIAELVLAFTALTVGTGLGARLSLRRDRRSAGRRGAGRGDAERALARLLSRGPATVVTVLPGRFHDLVAALGRGPADELLAELGRRLRRVAGARGVVAPIAPATFAVAIAGEGHEAEHALDALLSALDEPLLVGGIGYPARPVLGIASAGAGECSATELLDRAEVALHTGDGPRRYYTSDIERDAQRRVAVLTDLEQALAVGQLHLHFQPIVDMATGRVEAAEALVRWDHPVHGDVPPSAFIPLAEQTDLIGPLATHVLGLALDHCAAWRREGLHLRVAVNLSAPNVADPDLAERVLAMLAERGLGGDALKLEITETILMQEPRQAAATLGTLRAHGVTISLDDFGTGYSSLAYLKDLPLDEVKIDRSFVTGLGGDDRSTTVLRTVVALASELDLRTVAEGIEDAETLAVVAGTGCTMAQGFYFSRPLAPRALRLWLDRRGTAGPSLAARLRSVS